MTAVPTTLIAPDIPIDQTFIWTVEQYEDMIAKGILTEADKVELLYGRIITKMPVGERHTYCVRELNLAMTDRYRDIYLCQQEQPIVLAPYDEPEPDYALIRQADDRYRRRKPTGADVVLVVEVAESSYDRDRGSKWKLYATHAIPEYWIVNLEAERIEVYTDPDSSRGEYRSEQSFTQQDKINSVIGEVLLSEFIPDDVWEP